MIWAFILTVSRQESDASDADSDLEELEGDIAKFDETVREFLATQRDEVVPSGATRAGYRGRGARGPRKAAKPRGDITARLSKVNQAFLSGDYDLALDLVFEVIRINAETHQAWTTLSSIFREQGDLSKALSAMVYAAHLRPKDVSGWLQCASFALDTIGDDEAGNLNTARLCYSAALRADHTNIDARLGKGLVCHRQGHLAAAISDYKTVLKHRPYDLEIVRKLAEACLDNKQADTTVPSAIAAYKRFFDHEKSDPSAGMEAPWHDIGIYMDLFAATGRYQDAIYQAKSLSRWLLGRDAETFWDNWQSDDREWDGDDERRLYVPEYTAGAWSPELYGQSFPWDLRSRLAIYRFRLGDEDEAMVSNLVIGLVEMLTRLNRDIYGGLILCWSIQRSLLAISPSWPLIWLKSWPTEAILPSLSHTTKFCEICLETLTQLSYYSWDDAIPRWGRTQLQRNTFWLPSTLTKTRSMPVLSWLTCMKRLERTKRP